MKRIRCVFHSETTASLVIYKDKFKCYGCGKHGNHSELPNSLQPKEGEIEDEEAEDVQDTFRYINTLPRREVRGLQFPCDERGYYLTWPGDTYYKYRLFQPGKGPKYIGPRGVKPPLFWATQSNASTLYVVEGEVNALSIAAVVGPRSVCSPGSATNFNSANLTKYLTEFRRYSRVILVLDNDVAGMKGLIEAKAFFFGKVPFVDSILLNPDANEILVNCGKEVLKEKLQRNNTR